MFEAYKVGVTLALQNQVSGILGLIARDFIKTDKEAQKLHTTLKEIKLLGMTGALLGGAGFAGLHALGKTLAAAKEYQQAFAAFKAINLGDAINSQADKFARGSSVIGASATDLIRTTRDLHTVLNDFGLAKQLTPGFAQLKFANQAVFGGHGLNFNEAQLRDLERIIEMKGGFKGAPDFLAQASMMQQVIASTGGMVKPTDYLNFIKTAGVAGRLLGDKSFYYGMEPLIQEMGGNRVGTALMSAYANLGQGRTTVRAANEMMRLGLLDPKMVEYTKIGTIKQVRPGALKGMDQFTSNPYEWMKAVLLPAMASKGITSEKGILNEISAIMTNRTGASLYSLMYLQQHKIEKAMGISQNAMTPAQMTKLALSTPEGAEMALGAAWKNLKIAMGESLWPIIIPGLNALAEGLRSFGQWVNRHPVRFDYMIKGFAGLSAALLFSGSVLTLKAAFMGISLLMPTLAGTITASVLPALGALSAALLPLAAIAYHKEIAGGIDSRAPGIGDALRKAFTREGWRELGWERTHPGGAPPSGGKGYLGTTVVQIDGRKVAEAATNYQYRSMNAEATSGSGFDWRSGYVPSALTGAR
ncbi:MAG: hypothetical protein K8U57_27815 [Planctomycetes bacterium]|nr:hypothetical protein [Planctomycetota bacterium]